MHHDPRNKKSEALVNTAIPIDEQSLAHLFPNEIHTETALHYDADKEKVIAATRRYFHDLLLEENAHGHVDPPKSGPILAQALAPRPRDLFEKNPAAASLIARVALLRHAIPETNWPPLDDTQLTTLLTEACTNKRTLHELTDSQALPNALRSTLPYPLDRQLDQLAPETLEVPSGSKIKIDYQLPPLSSFIVQPSSFPPPSSPSASRNSSASSTPHASPPAASPSSSTSSPPATNPSKSPKTSAPSGPTPTSKSAKTSARATPNTNGPKTPSPQNPKPKAARADSAPLRQGPDGPP